MNNSSEQVAVEETTSIEMEKSPAGRKAELAVLCVMLALALVGMGLSQALEKGAWEYWLLVVVVYAALSLWRSTQKARSGGKAVGKLITRQLAHWGLLLAFLAVLLLLERQEIINRQSASQFALMLLAFSCCLAGIHFDWLLLIIGAVLTFMLVAMASLQQYSIVLWIIMIVVVVAAAAFYYVKSKRNVS